jgi:hypothetical protein
MRVKPNETPGAQSCRQPPSIRRAAIRRHTPAPAHDADLEELAVLRRDFSIDALEGGDGGRLRERKTLGMAVQITPIPITSPEAMPLTFASFA